MNVLLIQPPIRDFYRTRFREYPLGLLYLASSLRNDGFDPSILDARYCKKPKAAEIPPQLLYLNDYYTKENDLFVGFKHFGMSYEEIKKEVACIGPDAVCLNAMFTPYAGEVIQTARAIKECDRSLPVIAGGHHATAAPDSLMESGYFDAIFRGEGELLLSSLLNGKIDAKTFPGQESEPVMIDDLDALPFPARDLIDNDRYTYAGRRYTMIVTSRGCPHSCAFCSVHTMAGNNHRKRSIDNVIAEIEEAVNKYDIGVIDFQDDNLLYDTTRVKILFEKLISNFSGKGLKFMAANGLNVVHLDEEILDLMKKAGFLKLDLALGTGDVRTRKALSRPESVDQYEKILKIAGKIGLQVTTYIILGIPFQPLAEMEQTIEYLKDKPTLISPSIFYNVPGMPIFKKAAAYEYSNDNCARRSSAFNSFGDDFTRDDIFRLFRDIRRRNILLQNGQC